MELCRHLRWKGHDAALSPAELLAVARRNAVPYQCLRTCQPWGVDDDPAVPEDCQRGRPCFTAQRQRAGPDRGGSAGPSPEPSPER